MFAMLKCAAKFAVVCIVVVYTNGTCLEQYFTRSSNQTSGIVLRTLVTGNVISCTKHCLESTSCVTIAFYKLNQTCHLMTKTLQNSASSFTVDASLEDWKMFTNQQRLKELLAATSAKEEIVTALTATSTALLPTSTTLTQTTTHAVCTHSVNTIVKHIKS